MVKKVVVAEVAAESPRPQSAAGAASSETDKPAAPPGASSNKKDKGKKKKGKHEDRVERKKGMIMNAHGEMVSTAQYALEQTLDATNHSLAQYRERMENLIKTNENLQETCQQQERDALDVIAALHAETEHKENELKSMKEHMAVVLEKARQEQEALMWDSEKKIQEMSSILNEKEAAFKVMQADFAVIKDFRKKRHDMLRELDYQKQELADTERHHKETVARMERKFFEEKIRLQKEANRKISELATKAHKEAVSNLKETTKEVYKENLRMAESLRFHVKEGEELTKQNSQLLRTNRQLVEEKDLHNVIVKEKILQAKQQAQEIRDLNLKIQSMEHALSHVVREFEHERDIIGKMARRELDDVRKFAERLRESLKRKGREMKHIKRLAQHILDQRSDLEIFFMDALDHVRSQIQQGRELARKNAQAEYNRKLREVMSNKLVPFPAVQSFRQHALNNASPSTVASALIKGPNSSYTNAADASHGHSEDLPSTNQQIDESPPQPQYKSHEPNARVDISDLSWDDKERVLRLLFAKMNGVAVGGAPKPQHHKNIEADDGELGGSGGRAGFSAAVSEGRLVGIDQLSPESPLEDAEEDSPQFTVQPDHDEL